MFARHLAAMVSFARRLKNVSRNFQKNGRTIRKSNARREPDKAVEDSFPEPRSALLRAAFAAHAEYVRSGGTPLNLDQINTEVAERRGGFIEGGEE